MNIPHELVVRARKELVVQDISSLPESCVDCPIAIKQQGTALQLQQLTGHIFDLATGETTTQEIESILNLDEDLADTFRELIDEFFPGADALEKSNLDNLRHLNDVSFGTIEWFIKHADRKIKNYEKLTTDCAGQGLRKVLLDRTEEKDPIELTLCSGELEGMKGEKSKDNLSTSAIIKETKSDDNPAT
jgi:hypothetical protein